MQDTDAELLIQYDSVAGHCVDGELFHQDNVRWGDTPLGLSGGCTLGSAGCLCTVAAGMLAAVFGVDTDPGRLNRWLCRNGGFTGGNRLNFGALEKFGLDGTVIDCSRVPAPMDIVIDTLQIGGGVLAKVDFLPGGHLNEHWVRILECSEEDCLIHDPWLPESAGAYFLMARYAHPSWDNPARAIFRLAIYLADELLSTPRTFSEHAPRLSPAGATAQSNISTFGGVL